MILLRKLLESLDEIHPTPPVKMVDPNDPDYDEDSGKLDKKKPVAKGVAIPVSNTSI